MTAVLAIDSGNRTNSIRLIPSGLSSELKAAYVKQGNKEAMLERVARLHPSIHEAFITSGVPFVVKEMYFVHARLRGSNCVDSETYRYVGSLDSAKDRSFVDLAEFENTHVIHMKDAHGRQVTSHVPGERNDLWRNIVPIIEACAREKHNIAYWIQEHITKKSKILETV